MKPTIDTTFKMYSDTPHKRDSDTYSRTLREYHLLLWSKPLPSGKMFTLTSNRSAPYYLYHSSDLGDFQLSSDSILHTYSKWKIKSIADIVNTVAKADVDAFYDLVSTIGGYIVFPSKKIEGQPTINVIRGINPQIKDRFDFTLECIRRWYEKTESPLYFYLDKYRDFFQLFENFQNYVELFLLNDLVDTTSGNIRFWLPFTDFGKTSPLPADVSEYLEYMKNVSEFAIARNFRIAEWAKRT